jgi:2-polyprenyl-3-methyl-5-hydroxy-6-metoxy-1,4-benzoquinol methylase
MPNFRERSNELELLDSEHIPVSDLYLNLRELNTINTYLGGHAVTCKALNSFELNKEITYTILDIGCGGGDNLISLAKWARKKGISLQLIGVDLKQDCISFAQKQCANYPEISLVCSDYQSFLRKHAPFDIIFNALFCHHFKDAQLQELFQLMKEKSKLGFFVNDLHRHPLAYYSIKWITYIFSRSYLVKNDACLSVLRGFSLENLTQLLPVSLYSNSRISWQWAFRWLIIYTHASK